MVLLTEFCFIKNCLVQTFAQRTYYTLNHTQICAVNFTSILSWCSKPQEALRFQTLPLAKIHTETFTLRSLYLWDLWFENNTEKWTQSGSAHIGTIMEEKLGDCITMVLLTRTANLFNPHEVSWSDLCSLSGTPKWVFSSFIEGIKSCLIQSVLLFSTNDVYLFCEQANFFFSQVFSSAKPAFSLPLSGHL